MSANALDTCMAGQPKTLITLATYNEIENLPSLVDEIFRHAPDADLLVVDDNSPDGTGRWSAEAGERDKRIHSLHRAGKLGLGTATIAAMHYAIEHGYELMTNLDADFSHPPRYLPALIGAMNQTVDGQPVGCAIGSRYVRGGGVEGWPLKRRLMSRAVNTYARGLLRLAPRDCSGAFRCYRTSLLAQIDFDSVRSRGYSFQEEILWHLKRLGCRFVEVPITFVDRVKGESKIDMREAVASLGQLFGLGVRNVFGR
jgi:dolichol-phosphate mannosyltransferase